MAAGFYCPCMAAGWLLSGSTADGPGWAARPRATTALLGTHPAYARAATNPKVSRGPTSTAL